jgi:hypothetical protein
MWKQLVKWAAARAFQWGLRKLTEEYGAKPARKPKRGKPKP